MKTAERMLAQQRLAEREVRRLAHAFQEEIQPFLDLQARIYGLMMRRMLIYADGRLESTLEPTPEQQAALDELRLMIDAIAKRYRARLLP